MTSQLTIMVHDAHVLQGILLQKQDRLCSAAQVIVSNSEADQLRLSPDIQCHKGVLAISSG